MEGFGVEAGLYVNRLFALCITIGIAIGGGADSRLRMNMHYWHRGMSALSRSVCRLFDLCFGLAALEQQFALLSLSVKLGTCVSPSKLLSEANPSRLIKLILGDMGRIYHEERVKPHITNYKVASQDLWRNLADLNNYFIEYVCLSRLPILLSS